MAEGGSPLVNNMAATGVINKPSSVPRFELLGQHSVVDEEHSVVDDEEHSVVDEERDTQQNSTKTSPPHQYITASEEGSTSEAILREAVQKLSSTHLDHRELADISALTFLDGASTADSKADYPFSENLTSMISFIPDSFGVINPLNCVPGGGLIPVSADSEGRQAVQQAFRCQYVDLRGKQPGLYRFSVVRIPHTPQQRSIKEDVSAYFQCREDEIHEAGAGRQWPGNWVIKDKCEQELVVVISFSGHYEQACFLCDRSISLSSALGQCKTWSERTFNLPSSTRVCLLRNGERLNNLRPFSHLHEFENLELVKVETLTLKFVLRLSQHCEKVYYIDCRDTDYVHEVKKKFLQVFSEDWTKQETAPVSENVWLTYGDTVLPEHELLRVALKPEDQQYPLDSVPSGEANTRDTFYVHFSPPDAVLVKLHFKADSRKNLTSESVLLVSLSTTTVEILRLEISKVIHKDPLSFKMFISGKKIEMETVLKTFLQIPNCTVVVEQRSQIELNVVHAQAHLPPAPDLHVAIHRYERVQKLKQYVSAQLDLPDFCIDLQHKDTRLDEFSDLRGSRLRHGDTINALVLPNRIRVRVRLESNHWENVVVNDIAVTTVEHLIAFVQAVITERLQTERQTPSRKNQNCRPSGIITFKAIYRGNILPHNATLREAGVAMNSRLLVLREESFCYTASCKGRVPIFQGSRYEPPEKVMVMCDGTNIFFANFRSPSADTPELFDSPCLNRPEGIFPCRPPLSAQFPPYSTADHGQLSPQPAAQTQPPSVCMVCKSASLPAFPSLSPIQPQQISRSQSSSFQDHQTNAGMQDRHTSGVSTLPSGLRHSTPAQSGGDTASGRSMDLCDGRAESNALSAPYYPDSYFSDSVSATPKRLLHRAKVPPAVPVDACHAALSPSDGDVKPEDGDAKGCQLQPPSLLSVSQQNKNAHSDDFLAQSQTSTRTRHVSESEAGKVAVTGQTMNRSLLFQQSVERDKRGHVVAKMSLETSFPPEMLGDFKRAISFGPLAPYQALTAAASEAGAESLPSLQPNRKFGDINESTIKLIANDLGAEGSKVMMDLISHNEVSKIEERFPKDPYRRFYECLVKWRQSQGSKASLDHLKSVLQRNERQDLVEAVEENEAEEAKAAEVKEQSYFTAP